MLVFTAEHTQVQIHGTIIFTRVFHAKATRACAETVAREKITQLMHLRMRYRAFTSVLSSLLLREHARTHRVI